MCSTFVLVVISGIGIVMRRKYVGSPERYDNIAAQDKLACACDTCTGKDQFYNCNMHSALVFPV